VAAYNLRILGKGIQKPPSHSARHMAESFAETYTSVI